MTGFEPLGGRHALVPDASSGIGGTIAEGPGRDDATIQLEEHDIRITTLMSGVADERLLEMVPAKAQMAMDNLVRPAQTATFFS